MWEYCRDLYKYPVAGIGFPEIFRNTEFLTFKDPVEIGYVVEPAFISDLGDGVGRIDQHAGGMAKADLVQAVDKGFSGAFFYKAAEGNFRHADQVCHFTQRYLFIVVVVHVFERLFDTPAIIGGMLIGK